MASECSTLVSDSVSGSWTKWSVVDTVYVAGADLPGEPVGDAGWFAAVE